MISSPAPRVAVLTFPGNNCETETVRALKKSGLAAEVFLWNMPAADLKNFSAVVVPGGFSFEDRGRSGVLAAQEEVFTVLKEMAQKGTPILGICNGAQILVESGLLLTDTTGKPAVALTHNKRKDETGKILGTGYFHAWQTLTVTGKKTPFTNFSGEIRVPIAHGEGRFLFPKELEAAIREQNLIVFQYVNDNGVVDPHFPTNPNGSFENAAAICSPSGTVVAMMPHPERSPDGKAVFDSLAEYLRCHSLEKGNPEEKDEAGRLVVTAGHDPLLGDSITFPPRTANPLPPHDISFFVRLKITDNIQKSFENLLRHQGHSGLSLVRRVRWDFSFSTLYSVEELKNIAEKLIVSHELVNLHKESVVVKIRDRFFSFQKGVGCTETCETLVSDNSFTVRGREDFFGEAKAAHLAHLFPDFHIEVVAQGIHWEFDGESCENFIQNPLFASFVSETIVQ
ncbi:MAG: phosphoribosylformylglycinamidine synthase I [Candidatus Peregrinibacteria bacterium]